jgi:hypothetical protein
MDTDTLLKAILIVSISISLLCVAVFIARVLESLKKLLDSVRGITDDAGVVSGTVADTVNSVKSTVGTGSIFKQVTNLAKGIGELKSLVEKVKPRKRSSKDQTEQEY